MLRQCYKCKENKETTEFYKCKSKYLGIEKICKLCSNIKNAERRPQRREQDLKRSYNITGEDYNKMLKNQDNCCSICKTLTPGGKGQFFHIDHNHKNGQIRGLLCHACNVGIGIFLDSPSLLESAISYLKKNTTSQRIDLGTNIIYEIQQSAQNKYRNLKPDPRHPDLFNTMCHTYAMLDNLVKQGILTHEVDAEGLSTYQTKEDNKK